MKLKNKVQISIAFSVSFLLIGGIINLFFYVKVNNTINKQIVNDFYINRNLNECENLINEIHTDILSVLVLKNEDKNKLLKEIDNQAIAFYESLDKLKLLFNNDSEKFEKAKKDFQNYYLYSKQLLVENNLLGNPNNKSILDKYKSMKNTQITGFRSAFKDYRILFEKTMRSTTETLHILTLFLIVIAVLGVVFSIIIQIFILNSVIKPLTKLFKAVKEINSGNLDFKADIHTQDEIGELAVNFNSMTDQLNDSFKQIKISNDNLEIEIKHKENLVKELEYLKNYLDNILESMPSALITVDQNQKITLINSSARELINAGDQHLFGEELTKVTELFNPYLKNFSDILQLKKPSFFNRQYLKNSDKALKNISIYPLSAEGFNACVIRTDDITEMEKIEEQLRQIQKMETIGSLAGGLAHDFNNVLGGIMGMVSLMKFKTKRDSFLDKDYLITNLDQIEQLCNRAHQMINQLLTLSRKHECNFSTLDLDYSIKNVIKICQNTFDKMVNIKYEKTPFPTFINGDPVQIEQVILNLCINAYHAMTLMRGNEFQIGGTLELQIEHIFADYIFCNNHPEAKEIAYWKLSVTDDGVGMNKNIISKVFEPFFTTKSKEKGTGLGLSMVYNIVQQHQGFIDIYSEIGVGTSINIYFPILENSPAFIENNQQELILKGDGLILIIDDEDFIRQTAHDMLTVCGYKTLMAADGRQGLKMYKDNWQDIDLVILDLIMPEKSGDQIFLELKEINPEIKVIIASGFRQDHRVLSSLSAGVINFMQKPYTIETLSKSVYNVLHNL